MLIGLQINQLSATTKRLKEFIKNNYKNFTKKNTLIYINFQNKLLNKEDEQR